MNIQRRRATNKEIAQGEREMKLAEERMKKEAEKRGASGPETAGPTTPPPTDPPRMSPQEFASPGLGTPAGTTKGKEKQEGTSSSATKEALRCAS